MAILPKSAQNSSSQGNLFSHVPRTHAGLLKGQPSLKNPGNSACGERHRALSSQKFIPPSVNMKEDRESPQRTGTRKEVSTSNNDPACPKPKNIVVCQDTGSNIRAILKVSCKRAKDSAMVERQAERRQILEKVGPSEWRGRQAISREWSCRFGHRYERHDQRQFHRLQ